MPITKDSLGLQKNFYLNGKLESIGRVKNLQRNNKWLGYFENGLLKWKAMYKDGKEDGVVFWNYPGGGWEKTEFKKGIRDGNSERFICDSAKEMFFYNYGKYINNKAEGRWIKKDPNGVILTEMTFINGKVNGHFVNNYDNGKLKIEGEIDSEGLNNFEYYDKYGHKQKAQSYQVDLIVN